MQFKPFLDMRGKDLKRMAAVPRRQCIDQPHVVAQRTGNIRVFDGGKQMERHRAAPDHVEHFQQEAVAGKFHEGTVDGAVGDEVVLRGRIVQVLVFLDHFTQLRQFFCIFAGRENTGGLAFDGGAGLIKLKGFFFGYPGQTETARVGQMQHTFLFQPQQRFAHRRAADVEFGCKFFLDQPVIRPYLARHDRLHQLIIDLVRQSSPLGCDAAQGHGRLISSIQDTVYKNTVSATRLLHWIGYCIQYSEIERGESPMCGIAGRILNAPGQVGRDLVALMDAQEHRGADSTGFAVYGAPMDSGYVLRGMGFDKTRMNADLETFRATLKEHGSDFLSDPQIVSDADKHYCFRIEISDPRDIAAWVSDADELSGHIEVQSCGRSLEIIKDIGGAEQVSEKHKVHDMIGTHGLGHARLATESSVLPNASHPFWARPFSDVAIVHNGQITDYFTWRDKLQRQGYRFLTENDS